MLGGKFIALAFFCQELHRVASEPKSLLRKSANLGLTALFFLCFAIGPFAAIGFGTDRYVTTNETSGEGSLPNAVAEASSGDNIVFDLKAAQSTIDLNAGLTIGTSMSFVNANTKDVLVELGDNQVNVTGTFNLGSNLTLQSTNSGQAFLFSGTIHLGECAGNLNARSTASGASVFDGDDLVIDNLTGTISAATTSGSYARGIDAIGGVEITTIGEKGSITADATAGYANGIYSEGCVSIGTLDGTISASSSGRACVIDAAGIQIGTFNGSLKTTSAVDRAYALVADEVIVGKLDGTITVEGGGLIYGIVTGKLDVSDSFQGTISTSTTSMIAMGVRASKDVAINDFSGEITTRSNGFTYGIEAGAGSCTFSGNTSGNIKTTSDTTDAYGIFSGPDKQIAIENFSGTIESNGKTGAYGMQTQTGGTVLFSGDCSGTIKAKADSGYAYGIFCCSDLTISNLTQTGSISAEGESEAYAVSVAEHCYLNNFYGSVSATAKNGFAFGLRADSGLNGGTADTPALICGSISAHGTDACALFGLGINIIVNDGATISATRTDSSGIAYAIYAFGGANQVELVAGCKIDGDIILNSETTDVLVLSGSAGSTTLDGAIVADSIDVIGGKWKIKGDISEGALLEVNGGSLTFIGSNKLASDIKVDSGSMAFDGETTGTATIQSGGTFMGNGIVGELLNHGTVAPGNSIGIITVSTDYTHYADGAMEVEINAAGDCDLIDVQKTAEIEGGTVDVIAQSGKYRIGSTYRFLTAKEGVSGKFTTVTDNLPFVDMTLVYGVTYVDLLLKLGGEYDSVAITSNQHGVARYLDNQKEGATGDFVAVLEELNTLDDPEARAAFDAMSGELFGSLSTIGIENHEQFLRSISQRLQSQSMMRGLDDATADARSSNDVVFVSRRTSCPQTVAGWTPWVQGYGIGASLAGDGNASGLGYSTGGAELGLEKQIGDNTRLGVAAGYASTHTNLSSRGDVGSIDGGQIALYAHHCIDSLYLAGITAYGYNSYSTDRQIAFADLDRTPHANYGGNNYSFYTEIGRTICGHYVHLQPYAALEYIELHQNDFVESGANSIDISAGGIQAGAFRGLIGSRVFSNFLTDSGRLTTLEGRAAWRHEFLDENRIIDASFAGQTGANFAIAGINVDRDNAILGTGVTCRLRSNLSVSANYDVVTSSNYTAHAGSGGLQYTW